MIGKLLNKSRNRLWKCNEHYLNQLYSILGQIYLSSYSTKKYESIYHYYSKLMLLDPKCSSSWLSLPRRMKLSIIISWIIVIFYISLTFGFNIDNHLFRYLMGDLTMIVIESNHSVEKSFLTLSSFTSLLFLIIIHQSFQTQQYKAFRTFLLYIGGDQNIFDEMKSYYSRSTVILLKYMEKNISNTKLKFRQMFNRVYCFAQIFHLILNLFLHQYNTDHISEEKSFWQIIIRIIMMQINIAVFIFLLSSLYSPLMIAFELIIIGFRVVRYCRRIIQNELKRYHLIIMDNNDNYNNDNNYNNNYDWIITNNDQMKWKQSSITVIQWELKKILQIFIRLIIFAEEVQKYLSKLLLLALIVTIVASQITLNCLEHLLTSRQHMTIQIFLFYFLMLDYIIIIFVTYFVSKLNVELNSIHIELNKIIIQMNESITFRFKFQLACYYERSLGGKPFGISIGSITVLKRSVFMKIIILYIRFTILSYKFR
ncbi:hypothetical protein DERP_009924 [Dermatophagoides pteronyssinus]|uniref:Gustatory receptor n=1 Tax=Dermatophagoides pteronyssinus TaxID=6956 RepID=A0ABQ8J289_DERPT|nr:hypothetical protein DERP_009924 [Dermatophagoides pteronyssinus]